MPEPPRPPITVHADVLQDLWVVTFYRNEALIQFLGSDILPTRFPSRVRGQDMWEEVQRLNPHARIRLIDRDGTLLDPGTSVDSPGQDRSPTRFMVFRYYVPMARWPWTLAVVWFLCLVVAMLGWTQAAYFPLFFLGSVLAAQRWTLPRWAVVLALLVGLAVLLQRHVTGSDQAVTHYFAAPGAALVILAITGGAAQRLLEAPPVQWLGQVSYSLYAVHFPVLLALSVLGTRAGLKLSVCGLLTVPVCLLMAAVTQRVVERPVLRALARPPESPARPFPAP